MGRRVRAHALKGEENSDLPITTIHVSHLPDLYPIASPPELKRASHTFQAPVVFPHLKNKKYCICCILTSDPSTFFAIGAACYM